MDFETECTRHIKRHMMILHIKFAFVATYLSFVTDRHCKNLHHANHARLRWNQAKWAFIYTGCLRSTSLKETVGHALESSRYLSSKREVVCVPGDNWMNGRIRVNDCSLSSVNNKVAKNASVVVEPCIKRKHRIEAAHWLGNSKGYCRNCPNNLTWSSKLAHECLDTAQLPCKSNYWHRQYALHLAGRSLHGHSKIYSLPYWKRSLIYLAN